MKKRVFCAALLCLALLIASLSACAPGRPETALPSPTPAAERRYALVVKDVTNPYMQRMFSGFEEACALLFSPAPRTPAPRGRWTAWRP